MNRNTMPLERYIERYGKEAGKFIYEWKKHCNCLPWTKAYNNARQRCSYAKANGYKYYGAKGIQCLITPFDLRNAFFRDEAWKFLIPSVDRIDPMKSYTPDNIRWIEFDINRKQRKINHPLYVPLYNSFKELADKFFMTIQ